MTTSGPGWSDYKEFYVDPNLFEKQVKDSITEIGSFLDPQSMLSFLQSIGTKNDTGLTSSQCILDIYTKKTSLTADELDFYLKTQGIDPKNPNFSASIKGKILGNVTSLDLSNTKYTDAELKNIASLCPNLTSLNLSWCFQIEDASFLSNLINLTSLSLFDCKQIRDFSFLSSLTNLTSLNLSNCTQIQDFSFLRALASLTSLNLSSCTQIQDFSFLRALASLTYLNLSWCPQIQDFTLLIDFNSLKILEISEDQFRPHNESIHRLEAKGVKIIV